MRICANVLLLTLVLLWGPVSKTQSLTALAQSQDTARKELVARAKALELKTPYVAPPGDPLEHDASGFAKVMCSAVFITGLDADFAAENVGFFTGPYQLVSFDEPIANSSMLHLPSITVPAALSLPTMVAS